MADFVLPFVANVADLDEVGENQPVWLLKYRADANAGGERIEFTIESTDLVTPYTYEELEEVGCTRSTTKQADIVKVIGRIRDGAFGWDADGFGSCTNTMFSLSDLEIRQSQYACRCRRKHSSAVAMGQTPSFCLYSVSKKGWEDWHVSSSKTKWAVGQYVPL